MAILGFSVFLDKVEDGRKCRTYRRAKCVHEKKGCNGIDIRDTHPPARFEIPRCYTVCSDYEYRIRKGGTIHAYTGLRQRKYCKRPDVVWAGGVCLSHKEDLTCLGDKRCSGRGAKLLRPDLPKCIDTYPIKLKDITEEDARLDGFESIEKGTTGLTKEFAKSLEKAFCISPLEQLKQILIDNYNAKPDTPIQAIIWEEIKGKRPNSE